MSLDALTAAIAAMSAWELLAVVFGVAYLLLAVRESLWCWYAAFAGTAISLYLFWEAGLLMESALQIYYLAMAAYGWWQWQQNRGTHTDTSTNSVLPICRWTWQQHGIALSGVLLLSAVSGTFLAQHTNAIMPYLDSFTTWGSILTTWMVTRKVLENWLYWLVIDGVSVYLYMDHGLYLFALLFIVYLFIVVIGFQQWLQHYRLINS
ncbi:MAG: nicotinamide riboside transporter PnuC [Parahaliea sp.]